MTNKKAIALVLGIMCFALTTGICIQIKTVKSTNSASSQNYEENNLRAEVLKYKEKYDNLLKETEKVDAQLQEQIESATKNNSELEEAKNQINEGNKTIGLAEVTGPGVIITVADSEIDSNSVVDATDFIIHDTDILKIVNELKNAGAEAISINDQRIVYDSYIADINEANRITVNGTRINAPPYIIKAIGNTTYLESAVSQKKYGYIDVKISEGKNVTLERQESITIPRYNKNLNFEYVKGEE